MKRFERNAVGTAKIGTELDVVRFPRFQNNIGQRTGSFVVTPKGHRIRRQFRKRFTAVPAIPTDTVRQRYKGKGTVAIV